MEARNLQVIGTELAIVWNDGSETYLPLETVRRSCPCAGCKGEADIFGNVYKNPEKSLTKDSVAVSQIRLVGAYGIQPLWGDGHSSGIFSWEFLQGLAGNGLK